jgi:hypothetical protein
MGDDKLTARLEQDDDDISALSARVVTDAAGMPHVVHAAGKLAGIADRHRDAILAVLGLHTRQDKPAHCWDHVCGAHRDQRGRPSQPPPLDCPDCRFRDVYLCTHCSCPYDQWPCPTYLAVAGALLGDDPSVPAVSVVTAGTITEDGGVAEIDPDAHWFDKLVTSWLLLLRVRCSCGWRSRARRNLDRAADDLIMHQAQAAVSPATVVQDAR